MILGYNKIFQQEYQNNKEQKKHINHVFIKVCERIDEELIKLEA